jgi:nucleolar protein 15
MKTSEKKVPAKAAVKKSVKKRVVAKAVDKESIVTKKGAVTRADAASVSQSSQAKKRLRSQTQSQAGEEDKLDKMKASASSRAQRVAAARASSDDDDEEISPSHIALPKSETNEESREGVVYIGHIPFGFFEDQMRAFLSQFGSIKHVRMSRNKKTGKSKHYAYVQFEFPEVAQVVAETMNNYLLFGQLIVCNVVAPDEVHPALWKGADRKFHQRPWRAIEKKRRNKVKTAEDEAKHLGKLLAKEAAKRRKLAAMGIDYEFPGYAAERPATSTKTTFND